MKINEFGIAFSTINGSGSATANNTIQRAIFKMGIPVSARNIFPSKFRAAHLASLTGQPKETYGRIGKKRTYWWRDPKRLRNMAASEPGR